MTHGPSYNLYWPTLMTSVVECMLLRPNKQTPNKMIMRQANNSETGSQDRIKKLDIFKKRNVMMMKEGGDLM